ncbi:MAG: outer membrane lipoprotein chaperone LolA [Gammaproteobacteria bacterium]|nr:outer membrane lipoprotein chaperone LolA [Gammaproteobacteria bacterium]
MKITFVVPLIGILMASQALAASAVEERLNKALKSLDNLQADFKQTVLDDNKEVVQQSMGQVSIQRPAKFKWQYQQPYEQLIVADGKELWVYDVDLDQVTVKPMEQGLASAPIMVLMKNQPVEEEFEVSEIGQRKFLFWIELVPRQKDMEFSRVYLGLEEGVIKAMELRDSFGQSTQIVFENQRNNVVFDPQTFEFDPPPGVDVFGMGG